MGFSLVNRNFKALDYYGPMTPFKRIKISTLLLAMAMAWPMARAEGEPVQNSELDSRLMYELLLAEFSASAEDTANAYQLMLDAAQRAHSDQLFQRAVEIALKARAGESALQAAQAWSRALPASGDANRYLLQILIGLNKLADTVDPIKRDLARLPSKERAAAINLLPRYFLRASDKKLAARVMEQALAGELGNATSGPAAQAAVGTMRLLAEDPTGALDAARKGAALNSRAEEPVQLAMALIDPAFPAAEALVLGHLQQGGAKPEIRMAYVRKLLEAQRYDDAYTQCLQLNTSTPAFAEAWLVRGSLALQYKKQAEAQTALSRYVELRQAADSASGNGSSDDRGLSQAYFLLAEIADLQQKPEEAQRYLALIDTPQDAIRVSIRRAAILARQGQLTEARALIRSAPEATPEDARTKLSAEVQLLRESRQFDLVYSFLKESVQKNPGDVDLRYDLAMAAEKIDKIDEMEILLRQVIADKPDYLHAYNALGYSLADRNLRLPEARTLVQKALEFAPQDPFIQDSLGWVEFRSGHLDEALRILQAAYQSRQDPEIAAHLGEVLWKMGRHDQARTVWQNGLQQGPDNETLRDTIKRLDTL
jgi:tetratricopeptide (TPR) repeat protein